MFNSPILVFDIETVPDAVSGRTALELDGIDDQDVVRAWHTVDGKKPAVLIF